MLPMPRRPHTPTSANTLAQRLAAQPIRAEPNLTHYEWAGGTLNRLLGIPQPVAETWAFFSGPSKPARIADTHAAGGLTMEDLVAKAPEVLGPAGADPENGGQKYFFVKFLDPSDFPPFAYLGFNPETIHALGNTRTARSAAFAELLWQDRLALERLAHLVRPTVRSRHTFEKFKAAYTRWAIAQASTDWTGPAALSLAPFVAPPHRSTARALLTHQCDIRRQIVSVLHRIALKPNHAILVETPTLHAIAGLSLQVHPNAPGNFHPKDEVWIYKEIPLPQGKTGWLLVEPQRTFDRTESGADFFTPFAWVEHRQTGGLGFRKSISQTSLKTFVQLIDMTPHPQSHYVRTAKRMPASEAPTRGRAHWYRIVEEPSWPYFVVRELRFDGPGESVLPLEHHSFIELHVTRGEVEVLLKSRRGDSSRCTVSPRRPAFLPASLPYDTITYRASRPAHLQWFSRPGAHSPAAPSPRRGAQHPRRSRGPGRS